MVQNVNLDVRHVILRCSLVSSTVYLRGEEFKQTPRSIYYNPEKVSVQDSVGMVELINRAVHHQLVGQWLVRTRNLAE